MEQRDRPVLNLNDGDILRASEAFGAASFDFIDMQSGTRQQAAFRVLRAALEPHFQVVLEGPEYDRTDVERPPGDPG